MSYANSLDKSVAQKLYSNTMQAPPLSNFICIVLCGTLYGICTTRSYSKVVYQGCHTRSVTRIMAEQFRSGRSAAQDAGINFVPKRAS